MSGVLVLGEATGGELRPGTLELIGAALSLARQGAGPVSLALIGLDGEAQAGAAGVAGVRELILVPSPLAHFEAHVAEVALRALVEDRKPSLVLVGHTVDSLGFVPAVAASLQLGFASDVTDLSWQQGGALARRDAYGGRVIAELDFPGKETVLLMLRTGAFAAPGAATSGERATLSRLELDLERAARTERVELRAAPVGEVDIAEADFVLSIGRGIGTAERLAEIERLAQALGATLAASGPLVEAGWVSRARKVGQSGTTVAPRVYLALGISGAAQHLAGVEARTMIAVNSDRDARIFDVADHGAVADLFEVAAELERRLAR